MDDQPEVESPFRKKKGGLQKLTLVNMADAQPSKHEALEQELKVVIKNLEQKRVEFQALQARTKQDISESHTK